MTTYIFFIIGFIIGNLLALIITNIIWLKNQNLFQQLFINYLCFIEQNLALILFNYNTVMQQDLLDDLNNLHDDIKKVVDIGDKLD